MNRAFITDMGQAFELRSGSGESAVIERYGVWVRSAGGRHEVIEVGNDLDGLCQKFNVSKDRVFAIKRKEEGVGK